MAAGGAAASGASVRSKSAPAYSLHQFEAIRELGTGSYGVVKQVLNRDTGQMFAMKVLEKRSVIQQGLQEQMRREVLTQYRVKHPHVLAMPYYFEDRYRIYCLLEYADQGQLFAYLRDQGSGVPEPRAARFFADTARGLQYLHGLRVAHRDLKPENILLFGEDLRAKVGDLGWCVELTEEEPERMTFCGTLDYIPPEMLLQEPHDFSVDLWALGVLLYEMLMACAPFATKSRQEAMDNICAVCYQVPTGAMSEGPRTLIHDLLQRERRARAPLTKVLQHPWVVALGGEALPLPSGDVAEAAAGPGGVPERESLEATRRVPRPLQAPPKQAALPPPQQQPPQQQQQQQPRQPQPSAEPLDCPIDIFDRDDLLSSISVADSNVEVDELLRLCGGEGGLRERRHEEYVRRQAEKEFRLDGGRRRTGNDGSDAAIPSCFVGSTLAPRPKMRSRRSEASRHAS